MASKHLLSEINEKILPGVLCISVYQKTLNKDGQTSLGYRVDSFNLLLFYKSKQNFRSWKLFFSLRLGKNHLYSLTWPAMLSVTTFVEDITLVDKWLCFPGSEHKSFLPGFYSLRHKIFPPSPRYLCQKEFAKEPKSSSVYVLQLMKNAG